MRDAATVSSYLNPAHGDELHEFDLTELECPVHLGAAVAVVYRDDEGNEYVHEFKDGADLYVDDDVIHIEAPGLTLSDLGIEEDDE